MLGLDMLNKLKTMMNVCKHIRLGLGFCEFLLLNVSAFGTKILDPQIKLYPDVWNIVP